MNGLGLAFVILPCLGATIMAALLWDWRLVAAATCGALGVLALGRYIPEPLRLFGLPVVLGLVIGSVFLIPRLVIRPSMDIWSRMLWALVPTFGVTFLFMIFNASGG